MERRSLASGILLAITLIGFLVLPAWAQEPPAPNQEPPSPNTGASSFTASLNLPTSYSALKVTGGKGFEVWGVTGAKLEY